jgi:Glycosyl transferase family 2
MSISVVIAVHNRRRLVQETINCLLQQTRRAEQIIVVDDASTDGTPEAVERFGSDVTLLRLQKNVGPGGARNAGLERARGDFIQFFDSDDLASCDLLEAKFLAVTEQQADIAYGPWLPVWIDNCVCRHDGFVRQSAPVSEDPTSAFLRGWVLFLPNCLVRRELICAVGGYPAALRTGEDMLLLFRLLKHGARLAHTRRSLLLVRQHPKTQISTTPCESVRRTADELRLTSAVLSEAGAGGLVTSSSAMAAWRARHAAALAAARNVGTTPDGSKFVPPPSLADFGRYHLDQALLRVRRALSARLYGHRIEPQYQPQSITADQLAAIRNTGLRPLRIIDRGRDAHYQSVPA